MDNPNSVTTRLLTLLNVSATKTSSRNAAFELPGPSRKLNRRKTLNYAVEPDNGKENDPTVSGGTKNESAAEFVVGGDVETNGIPDAPDSYEEHFGVHPSELTPKTIEAIDNRAWKISRGKRGRIGMVVESAPEGVALTSFKPSSASFPEKLQAPLKSSQCSQTRDENDFQNHLLSTLSGCQDFYHTSISLENHALAQAAVSIHALSHVVKKRRIILKNNDRLAAATKLSTSLPANISVHDQGFTRPSILFLLPTRSFALSWLTSLTMYTPPPAYQIENHARFVKEYNLPPGTTDKLSNAEPGLYPADHVDMFKGNIDESFRIGVKITRKSVKLFSDFYSCDIILASPLGLKLSIEKEKNADFLSSIEVVVCDRMDALTMQNWEHVKFVFSNLNMLPKESHDTDFSRVKPWYLDSHAGYVRQSILLSAYETPEMRALFNNLKNFSGKLRVEKMWEPIGVPEGIYQQFIKFDSNNLKDEADKRFNFFTTVLLPTVLKSAVQSVNTVVFIPSSFDFIRVRNHFKTNGHVTFGTLSEESSNQDISRARQAFFSGKDAFLLVSERYHFYRRYKLRGVRNLIFYALPEHPQFYTEFLSYPFLDQEVESTDVTCRALFSKWDWFTLERIVGTKKAAELLER